MGFFSRRLFLVGALLVALVMLMAPLAGADDDDDDDDNGCDVGFATGDFTFAHGGPREHLAFFACDNGPAALDSGFIDYHNPDAPQTPDTGPQGLDYEAEVICASVVGNIARFGYVIPPEAGPPWAGQHIVWQVIDNGPEGGPPPPDTAGYAGVANAALCDGVVTVQSPVLQGDIVVRQGGGGGDDEDDD
jgi:hypothetical protein